MIVVVGLVAWAACMVARGFGDVAALLDEARTDRLAR